VKGSVAEAKHRHCLLVLFHINVLPVRRWSLSGDYVLERHFGCSHCHCLGLTSVFANRC